MLCRIDKSLARTRRTLLRLFASSLDGVYVNCFFPAISLSALVLLGVAQRFSKRYVYTQLSDGKFGVASAATTPEHSVQSSFSSFSQLATLYEEHDGEEQGLELDVITNK